MTGQQVEAAASLRQGIALLEDLSREYPGEPRYRAAQA